MDAVHLAVTRVVEPELHETYSPHQPAFYTLKRNSTTFGSRITFDVD